MNQVLLRETLTLLAGWGTGKERLMSAHARVVVIDLGGWVLDKASISEVFVTISMLTNKNSSYLQEIPAKTASH